MINKSLTKVKLFMKKKIVPLFKKLKVSLPLPTFFTVLNNHGDNKCGFKIVV